MSEPGRRFPDVDGLEIREAGPQDERTPQQWADDQAAELGDRYAKASTTKQSPRGLRSWEWPVSPPHSDPWTPVGEEAG